MSVLVVGSVALDTTKTPFGKCKNVLGGSATYFSVSASFFSPVNIVAVVGEDFPKEHIRLLKKKGINTEGLQVKKGKTFRWEGEYGFDFNNAKTLATHLNLFAEFDPTIPAKYKRCKYLFLANIDPEIQQHVLKQVSRPALVASDTMNYWIENKPKQLIRLLEKIDLFLLNEAEARQLTGEANLAKAARSIINMGTKRVIIKRGEHGSLLFSLNSIFSVPAFLLESIVDPTGAGDTFAGGVIGYLAQCKNITEANLRKAIVMGSVMATFTIEDFSLRRLVKIKKPNINERFSQFKKQVRF